MEDDVIINKRKIIKNPDTNLLFLYRLPWQLSLTIVDDERTPTAKKKSSRTRFSPSLCGQQFALDAWPINCPDAILHTFIPLPYLNRRLRWRWHLQPHQHQLNVFRVAIVVQSAVDGFPFAGSASSTLFSVIRSGRPLRLIIPTLHLIVSLYIKSRSSSCATATENDGCYDGSYENSRDATIASDGSRREPQRQYNYSDDGLHNPTSRPVHFINSLWDFCFFYLNLFVEMPCWLNGQLCGDF